jgi:hypothetical protein
LTLRTDLCPGGVVLSAVAVAVAGWRVYTRPPGTATATATKVGAPPPLPGLP